MKYTIKTLGAIMPTKNNVTDLTVLGNKVSNPLGEILSFINQKYSERYV